MNAAEDRSMLPIVFRSASRMYRKSVSSRSWEEVGDETLRHAAPSLTVLRVSHCLLLRQRLHVHNSSRSSGLCLHGLISVVQGGSSDSEDFLLQKLLSRGNEHRRVQHMLEATVRSSVSMLIADMTSVPNYMCCTHWAASPTTHLRL